MRPLVPGIFLLASALAGPGTAHALSLIEGLAAVTASGWEVRIARSQADASRASVDAARSGRLPRVEAHASHTWLAEQPGALVGPSSVYTAEKQSLSYGVSATQILYDFGRTGSSVRAAQAGLEASSTGIAQSANSAARDFVLAYVSLLEAQRLLEVSEQEVSRFEAHLADAEAFHREGVVTVNDVLTAEVNLADSRQRMVTARSTRDLLASRLNFLLGNPLVAPVSVEEFSGPPDVAVLTLQEAFDRARRDRPELGVISSRIDALSARLEARRAGRLPSLFVSGGYSYTENQYQLHEDNWALTAGLSWELYSGGARNAEISQASAELAALMVQRDRLTESVQLEVADAFRELASAREKVVVSEKAVEQARESLRLEKAMYEEGEGTSNRAADAVTRLARAEQNHLTALYAVKRAETMVLYAVGKDLASAYSN